MINIDVTSLYDDFESEAKEHIETIETAFLDISALVGEDTLIDGVFRAAHSLKGTASLLSLSEIVKVAHELENVFSRIKDKDLTVDDEMADVVLLSVDTLREMVNNLKNSDTIDTSELMEQLKTYSVVYESAKISEVPQIPFDLNQTEIKKLVKSARKRGRWIYYLNIDFNRSLENYYEHPKSLIDEILSVGDILQGIVNDVQLDNAAPSWTEVISKELEKHDTSVLSILMTSVLQPELLLIALELNEKSVYSIPEAIEVKEATEKKIETKVVSAEPSAPSSNKSDFTIRLDISTVNGLMDLANEMILTRNQLLSFLSGQYMRSIHGLSPVLHDMNRLTSEIQEKMMLTRMQPVQTIFGKFPRMIRDIAKQLKKEIRIQIVGGDVALDKYLLDALSDPITQLVKNSADHGIESAGSRMVLGKQPEGLITLCAYMRDNMAIIEVSDDGAGLNEEAVKRKVLTQGMVTEEQLLTMNKNDILQFIFLPGFSTAKHVTNVSGRGVGMDIVKTNIEKLGGSVEIDSELTIGTTIRLKMPLTLSVTRTLIITIDSVGYAVSESNVERIIRISAATPSRYLEQVANSVVLNLDGWMIPVITMEGLDAKASGREPPLAQELISRVKGQEVIKCLVLKTGSRYFALLIEDALETEETLVKPLPLYLRNCRCYSGVTVLGNGKAVMILDAEGILKGSGMEGVIKEDFFEENKLDENDLRQIVIFHCSGPECFAVDADRIAKIERIDREHIQDIGQEQFVNIDEKTVKVIRPEDYVPVQKNEYQKKWLYLLRLKGAGPATGILAGKIVDKVNETFILENDFVENNCVLGTGVYGEKILVFLDVTEIARVTDTGVGRYKQ